MIERVEKNKILYAIIVRSNYKEKDCIKFFTPNEFSQQLAYMNRSKGYKIKPHIHKKNNKMTTYTQEVLFIKSGKVRVDFYDESKNYVISKILNSGDIILLSEGGHGFEFLDDAEIIEVKQGPYDKDKDKIRFDKPSTDKISFE